MKPDAKKKLKSILTKQQTERVEKAINGFLKAEQQYIREELRGMYVPASVRVGSIAVSCVNLADAERTAVKLHKQFYAVKKPASEREIA